MKVKNRSAISTMLASLTPGRPISPYFPVRLMERHRPQIATTARKIIKKSKDSAKNLKLEKIGNSILDGPILYSVMPQTPPAETPFAFW
jgi:hypothetical protein